MKLEKDQIYYHFVGANKRLRKGSEHEDIEVVIGRKLVFDGKPILCQRGFHASKQPLDALKYAPSDAEWLCGVQLGGTIVHDKDKSVATERTTVWILNVRKLLVEFALWNVEQAFQAIQKIGIEPDEHAIEAVRVVRLWLVDKATKEELSTAARAAGDARDAARAADAAARAAYAAADGAYAAAYNATYGAYAAAYAVGAAARAAAYAVGAAARAAVGAYGSTYYAARSAQNEQLEKMIRVEIRKQNAK